MNDHHHHTLLPDDPRITAFALGNSKGDDRAAVEAALRHDPGLRATVEQIRATVAQIEAALAEDTAAGMAEPGPVGTVVAFPGAAEPVAGAAAAAILPGAEYGKPDGGPYRGVFRYPKYYYMVGGLAAACFAVLAVLLPPPPAKPKPAVAQKTEKVYLDMNTLLRPADAVAVAPVAPVATEPVEPKDGATAVAPKLSPTREEAVTIAGVTDPKLPRTLLEQAKDLANAPVTLSPTGTNRAEPDFGRAEKTAAGRSVTTSPAAGEFKLTQTGGQGASRVLTHPADEKFVVEVQPAKPVPGLAVSDRGSIFNESRGMPGASLNDITKGLDFDTIAPRGVVQPSPGALHLSPFTVSVDRVRALAAAAAAARAAAEPEKPATVLAGAKAFETSDDPPAMLPARAGRGTGNTEVYGATADNGFLSPKQNPFSTFGADTDTASYANVRRFVQTRQRPPREAVRIEELLNNFPYAYPAPPAKSDAPFAATLEVSEAPWAPLHRLVRIGVKGHEVATADRPAANLVFLLDVSGSMNAPNRLPLVKESMRLLLTKLRPDDRVAIVTYAGQSGLALPSTPVSQGPEILAALDSLATGGATNGALGIQLAYDIARANRVEGGINRVILCTDGDFNVGVTDEKELAGLVEEKAKSGTFLTVLGYGMGNLKDRTLEQLAAKGGGHYGYIDSRKEAEKLLVQQVNGTLVPIAKDVKIRVEFNPSQVASYRLIGYENRLLKKDEFADDKVDAGEVGAGHTITALYEVVPVGVGPKVARQEPEIEDRRYNFYAGVTDNATLPGRIDPYGKELLTVKVRYKKPGALFSRALDFPLTDGGGKFSNASPDFKFAAAVAGFGMILRESPHKGTATMANVIEWAEAGAAEDAGGYRSEFIELARQADQLEK